MEVKVTLHLPVDREAWETAFGVAGAAQVREDVREYVTALVNDSLSGQGLLT